MKLFDLKALPLNFKQEELAEQLFLSVKERYPEIVLRGYRFGPDARDHLWIVVLAPMDEEREAEMGSYAAERSSTILLEHGYLMTIIPENPLVEVPLYGQ